MDEKNENREELVSGLKLADLRLLTGEQLAMCKRVEIERANKKAADKVSEIMDGKTKDVLTALTTPPFIYTSPEIKVMAGCAVNFVTLMKCQVDDSHRQLDEFITEQDPNQLRIGDSLNSSLLAHALAYYNGQEFGGVVFDAQGYQGLRSTDPKKAQEMLEEVRNKRLAALGDLSPHVYQRLVEYWQAFQMTVESMTQDSEEALGN